MEAVAAKLVKKWVRQQGLRPANARIILAIAEHRPNLDIELDHPEGGLKVLSFVRPHVSVWWASGSLKQKRQEPFFGLKRHFPSEVIFEDWFALTR